MQGNVASTVLTQQQQEYIHQQQELKGKSERKLMQNNRIFPN